MSSAAKQCSSPIPTLAYRFVRFLIGMSVFFFAAAPLFCQADLSGEWQGSAKGTDGNDYGFVLTLAKKSNGLYGGVLSIEDVTGKALPVGSIAIQGSEVRFSVPPLKGAFRGVLAPDHSTMRGQWTDSDGPVPLTLEHVAPHKVSSVAVAPDVKLEVLDWSGTGRPLVLLAGLGDTAHVFDKFAPKLTAHFHVYGITRRGYGNSSHPDPTKLANYTADRLGDDVLAVFTALHLQKPILVGHSIAGEELSSIGSRHPERVAGLIYLDAAYGYAHYDPALGDYSIDLIDLDKKLGRLIPGFDSPNEAAVLKQIQVDLPRFERDVQDRVELNMAMPDPDATKNAQVESDQPQPPSPGLAILLGQQKYSSLPLPVLAIFALPHSFHDAYSKDPTAEKAAEAYDLKSKTAIVDSFERGVPTAKVVRIPLADHYVFQSNEADVLREIDAFTAILPH